MNHRRFDPYVFYLIVSMLTLFAAGYIIGLAS